MRREGPWRTVQPRESIRIWARRLAFNFFPAFRATGARVIYISEDMRKLRIKLPLNLRTRNFYGTLFGGAMYAATDPLYAMLVRVALGTGYTVWDKAASIRYRKPGRSTLYAECSLSDAQVAAMRKRLESEPSLTCIAKPNLSTRTAWCTQSCRKRCTQGRSKHTNHAQKPLPPGSARISPV